MRQWFIAAFIVASLMPLCIAQNRGRGAAAAPAEPAPRHPDGRVNFGPLPGETGLWLPGAGLGVAAYGAALRDYGIADDA